MDNKHQLILNRLKKKYPKGVVHAVVAGHGGLDEGGKYHIIEEGSKQIQFPDGLKIYEGNENRNIKNTILEVAPWYKGLEVLDVIPGIKDEPLYVRREIFKQLKTKFEYEGKLLVLWEIHLNAFKLNKAKGREVYTTVGDNFSDMMASIWFEEANNKYPDQVKRVDISDGDADKEINFYLIRELERIGVYGILTECFFFDNREEVDKYCNPEGYAAWAEIFILSMLRVNELWEQLKKRIRYE